MKKAFIILLAVTVIVVALVLIFDKDNVNQPVKDEKKIDSVMNVDKDYIDSVMKSKKGVMDSVYNAIKKELDSLAREKANPKKKKSIFERLLKK